MHKGTVLEAAFVKDLVVSVFMGDETAGGVMTTLFERITALLMDATPLPMDVEAGCCRLTNSTQFARGCNLNHGSPIGKQRYTSVAVPFSAAFLSLPPCSFKMYSTLR